MNTYSGLDVHKGSVFACIIDENRKKIFEKRFGTLTTDLQSLRDELLEHSVKGVAMESTSIYWMPVWRILQPHFPMKLANPYFIKQLPGRKSDVKDAQWIAECLQKDSIKYSFVPDEILQQMRQYSRRYRYLIKSKVRVEQRLDNHLQRCDIRFSNYVSNQGNKICLRQTLAKKVHIFMSFRVAGRYFNIKSPRSTLLDKNTVLFFLFGSGFSD
jgi:transposase